MILEYSDQNGHRGRLAFCYVYNDHVVHSFKGENIPSVARVMNSRYEKNGKWSNTTYLLDISDDYKVIKGHYGWETGDFLEGITVAAPSASRTAMENLAGYTGYPPSDWAQFAVLVGQRSAEIARRTWTAVLALHAKSVRFLDGQQTYVKKTWDSKYAVTTMAGQRLSCHSTLQDAITAL